jgi:DNA (cytosine-5)-methyltransferase 1
VRFISLFSGFGGAELAWAPVGWECVAVAEVDAAACAVLAHNWPEVPNLGNVQKITEAQIQGLGQIDAVVFGFPCQDLSVAGKRKGLKGERSGLFFDAMRIVRWSGARFAVAENVPGLFSSHSGRDFAAVVGEMAGVQPDVPDGGWSNSGFLLGSDGLVEWAVLDAQFFGVPQRRRRVFIVRDIGDWQSRPPILLERESLCGHTAPSRKAGQVAPTIPARSLGGGGLGTDFDRDGGAIASTGDTSHCLNAGGQGRIDYETETFITHSLSADGFDASEDGTGRGTPLVPVAFSAKDYGADAGEIAPTLRAGGFDKSHANSGNWAAVAFAENQRGEVRTSPISTQLSCSGGKPGSGYPAVAINLRGREGGSQPELSDVASVRAASGGSSRSYVGAIGLDSELNAGEDVSGPLKALSRSGGGVKAAMSQGMQVRRLTPKETARLQGVPDDHCRIPYKGRMMADGPIYKMHGNGFAVPVVQWIGKRLAEVLA